MPRSVRPRLQIKQEVTRGLDAFKQKRQAEELGDLNDKSAATAEAAAMTAATVTFVPTKRRKRTVGNARNNIVVSNAAKKDAVTTTSTKSKTAIETSTKAASPKLPNHLQSQRLLSQGLLLHQQLRVMPVLPRRRRRQSPLAESLDSSTQMMTATKPGLNASLIHLFIS